MYEEEESQKWSEYIVKYWYILIAATIFFMFKGKWGFFDMDNALYWAGIIGLGGGVWGLTWTYFENKTPKVIFNYGFSTTDGEIETGIGNYAALQHSIKALGIYWKLDGMFFFPEDGYSVQGPNINIHCRMEKKEFGRLPNVIRNFITSEKKRPPYWMGYADISQYQDKVNKDGKIDVTKPKIAYIISELEQTNKQNDILTNMMEALRDEVSKTDEWAKILKRKGSTVEEAIKSFMKDEDSK